MKRLRIDTQFLSPVFLAVVLLTVYGLTLAPGLTWSNSGADGGDLIAAAATGGVPHPTGYPVYLLLAGVFQHFPFGSLAFCTNLFSALATVAAALLVFKLVAGFLESSNEKIKSLAGLSAAFAFGLSPLVWSQAVITEVYALHVFFVVLILYLSSGLAHRFTRGQLDCLTGLVFGLGMANHATTVFLLPVVFAPALTASSSDPVAGAPSRTFSLPRVDLPSLLRRFAFMCLGLTPYLILPLRAASKPPVNWGDPVTLSNFFWLVTGRLYQHELLDMALPIMQQRTESAVAMLLTQFGILGLFLGLLGLIWFFSKSRLYWNMIWMVVIYPAFAISYGSWDSYVYLLPVFLCFAIWIGIALGRIMEQMHPVVGYLFALLFAVYLAFLAVNTWPRVDVSHDQAAENFGRSVLTQAPGNAIVFAKGDDAVFALWYFSYALHERPDIVIVASDLLHHTWYQQVLRDTYSSLNVPGPLPFEETIRLANPSHPACYVQASGISNFQCLPPAQK